MVTNSNTQKCAILGMPHGTAVSKLRKNILFHLLKKHAENVCFRCGCEIEVADVLSIEHKKPWQSGASSELFWDLENIAFSHMSCNRPHREGGVDNAIKCPEGTSWCSKCRKFLTIDWFWKNSYTVRQLDPYCIPCRKIMDERKNHAKKV
jgi:hypothetical protein